jgi:GT2 family glycosyltransferase
MKTSIIILNFNTLEHLKRCVESVKVNTTEYELIIVDNGSTEKGTKEFIKQNSDKHIFNKQNNGFPKGNNQGAEIASGDFLCFLNSDTIVSPHWLDEMFGIYTRNRRVGMVGPLGNPQVRVINKEFILFQQYIGQYSKDAKVNKLVGFCLLIKKDLFNEIKFDEDFGLGQFEDNLLCDKIREMGYNLWVASNSYVFHPFPSRTFQTNNINQEDLLRCNGKLYREKSGVPYGRI